MHANIKKLNKHKLSRVIIMPRNRPEDIPDDMINPPPMVGEIPVGFFQLAKGQGKAAESNEFKEDAHGMRRDLAPLPRQAVDVGAMTARSAMAPLLQERGKDLEGEAGKLFAKAEAAGSHPRNKPFEVHDQDDNIEAAVDTVETDEFKEWLSLTQGSMAEYVNQLFGGVEAGGSLRLVKPEDFALAIYQKPKYDEDAESFVQKNQYAVVLATNKGIDLTRQGHIPKIINNINGEPEILRDAGGDVIYVDMKDLKIEQDTPQREKHKIANPPIVIEEEHKKHRYGKQKHGRDIYDFSRYRNRRKDAWQDVVGEEEDPRFIADMPNKEGEFTPTDLREGLNYAVATRLAEQNSDIEEAIWLAGEDAGVSLAPQAMLKNGTIMLSARHGARTGLIVDPIRYRPVVLYR